MNVKKSILAAFVLGVLTIGASVTEAAQVSSGYTFTGAGNVSNFTNLASIGFVADGTNDVTFTWDGTVFTSSSDYTGLGSVSNATISSPTGTFIGHSVPIFAHDVQIFGPGSYSFDTTLGGGNGESGTLTMNVGSGQFGMHMLLDWNTNDNMDVVNVWNLNSTFSNCGLVTNAAINCLWTGPTNTVGNNANTVFLLASTDNNGDGILGVPMATGGPFSGFNSNFNLQGTLTPVPVPAAFWLFGSGLLGLIGIARRKASQIII